MDIEAQGSAAVREALDCALASNGTLETRISIFLQALPSTPPIAFSQLGGYNVSLLAGAVERIHLR